MRVESVVLREIAMPLREPFVASYGAETHKHAIIVEARTAAGAIGFAECVAGQMPHYTEETTHGAWQVLTQWIVPSVFRREFASAADIGAWFDTIDWLRGNRMAKAGMEMALWDALSADAQQPLVRLLGGTAAEVPVGISIGLQATVAALIDKVGGYLDQGFQRLKIKIEPGRDVNLVREIRRAFPDAPLMVDANSAYQGYPLDHLAWLDEHGLMMVEQPLAHDDLVDHAALQRRLRTPICLDESVRSAADVRRAAAIGAGRVVNVKPGRVGGFTEAVRLHAASLLHQMPLWCGGMLETGIGRLHNIALTALPGFTLPGDTAPSTRYFAQDVIDPPVEFCRPGWLAVEPLCGVGARVQRDRLEKWTVRTFVVRP